MPLELPTPVRRYFEAERADDTRHMGDFFAADATVTDEGRTYTGLEAIRIWKQESKAATSYQVTPLKAEQVEGRFVVTGRVEGDFPGSPVNLRYFFRLSDDRIMSLEIRL